MIPENISSPSDSVSPLTSPRAGGGGHYRAELTCPITWGLMPDAVVLSGDGNTYSRQGLVSWFVSQLGEALLAPKSNVPLPKLCLVPNQVVRRLVAAESAVSDVPECLSVSERGVCLATLDAWDLQAASLPLPTQRRLLRLQAHLLFEGSQIPPEILTPTGYALPQAWAAIIDELPEVLQPSVKLACQSILAPAGVPTALPDVDVAAEPINWQDALSNAAALGILMFARDHLKAYSVLNQRTCILDFENFKAGTSKYSASGTLFSHLLSSTLPMLAGAYIIGRELSHALRYRPPVAWRVVAKYGFRVMIPMCVSMDAYFSFQAWRGCEAHHRLKVGSAERKFDFFLGSQEAYLRNYSDMARLESVLTGPLFFYALACSFFCR